MKTLLTTSAFLAAVLTVAGCETPARAGAQPLPGTGDVLVDKDRGEVVLAAVVQHPKGKPCIDDWGQRVQAFAGCRYAAGGPSKFADFFVFLTDAPTERVYEGLLALGARTGVHCTIAEGKKRSGLTPSTKPDDYLQGDTVVLSVFWKEGGGWKELPYDAFVREKVVVEGKEVEKPWTPHFVFHGSGAIHTSRTGCIACPCDCPGGIIADNRYPIYNPKPVVRFDWSKAPPEGTRVYVRIRPVCSR
ncbi:MAG: YdjY domain-containing protein [Planctomycetota bacterium]|jgi:hypothetical protein